LTQDESTIAHGLCPMPMRNSIQFFFKLQDRAIKIQKQIFHSFQLLKTPTLSYNLRY